MKRCLLLLALLMLAVPVQSMQLDFQSSGDALMLSCPGCTWNESVDGGNSVLDMNAGSSSAYQFGYFDYLRYRGMSGEARVHLYNYSYCEMYSHVTGSGSGVVELYKSGNLLSGYVDGTIQHTANLSYRPPDQPCYGDPAFWTISSTSGASIDDLSVSDYDAMMSFANGETYQLKKDIATPANSGLYDVASGLKVRSDFPVTYSRCGISDICPTPEPNLTLYNAITGINYQTVNVGSVSLFGRATFDLTSFFETTAPCGLYKVTDSVTPSADSIVYTLTGATVEFDKDSYSRPSTANVVYTITGSSWNTRLYTYRLDVLNVLGGIVYTSPISSQAGSKTFDFEDSDVTGTYYAAIVADPRSGGDDLWLAVDYADLDAFVTFEGYVNNETTLPISAANVTFTFGTSSETDITIADGNYSIGGITAGSVVVMNVTATGYSQYYVTQTPPVAKTIALNFTLNSTTPATTGMGIGGVARDGIFNDTTRVITQGYGRPLSGATVYLWNLSNNEGYTKTTNNAGWYLCDEGASCTLTAGRIYDVQGRKAGYNNSVNYTVVTS